MSKPTNLLARIFSRGQGGPLVSQIYSRAINRPLLVEPGMAEALIEIKKRAHTIKRGYRITWEPPILRHFQAHLEPIAKEAAGKVYPAAAQ